MMAASKIFFEDLGQNTENRLAAKFCILDKSVPENGRPKILIIAGDSPS